MTAPGDVIAYCRNCDYEMLSASEAIDSQVDGCPECGSFDIEKVWDEHDWEVYNDPDNKWNMDPRV